MPYQEVRMATLRTFVSLLIHGPQVDDAEAEVHFHHGPQADVAVCHDPRCEMPRLDVE
jgi:hypothetical protein